MIYSVTGLPGEGKTCFSVQHIILAELMTGKRVIWSNIEWHKDKVLDYCKEYGYEVDPDRLRIIPDDEIPKFWEYCSKNSLIVLDEVAEHFNSHAWQEIGTEAGSWARQHRKLGQETYFVVQDVNHIYKQFRDLIAEEIKIVNMSNKPIFGFFMPKCFVAKWVLKGQFKPVRTKTYRFNTDVFEIYNTNATVGGLLDTGDEVVVKETVVGKQKHKIRRKVMEFVSGHWYQILGAGMVLCFICFIMFAPKLIGGSLSKEEKNEKESEITQKHTEPIRLIGGGKSGTSYDIGRYDSISKRRP